jgi:hypothetical protein
MTFLVTGLVALLLAVAIVSARKHRGGKYVAWAAAALAVIALLGTYGRWEYLSWRHGETLRPVVVSEFRNSHLPIGTISRDEDIAQLKVFSSDDQRIEVFVEDAQGNKWLVQLHRAADQGAWSAYHDGAWQIEMIHSTMGGSASRKFYWY